MAAVSCPNCGGEYESNGIVHHWSRGDCDRPELNQTQKDIALGLMLGDGSLQRHRTNAGIQVQSTTKSFLGWIEEQVGWLCTGTYTKFDGEEKAQKMKERDPEWDCVCKDYWQIRLRSHPYFNRYREWYEGEEGNQVAVANGDVWLSPMVVKVWWASDGSFGWSGEKGCARIPTTNNAHHFERFADLFEDEVGVRPSIYEDRLRFSHSDTKILLDYMGDHIPGFYHKWCPNRRRYDMVAGNY